MRPADWLELPGIPQRDGALFYNVPGHCQVVPAVIPKGFKFVHVYEKAQKDKENEEESQQIQLFQVELELGPVKDFFFCFNDCGLFPLDWFSRFFTDF